MFESIVCLYMICTQLLIGFFLFFLPGVDHIIMTIGVMFWDIIIITVLVKPKH